MNFKSINNVQNHHKWYSLRVIWTTLFIIVFSACKQNPVETENEKVSDYFPLVMGNAWTYQVEELTKDDKVLGKKEIIWRVNDDLFMEIFEKMEESEDYLAYKAFFVMSEEQIKDLMGLYLSTKYLAFHPILL